MQRWLTEKEAASERRLLRHGVPDDLERWRRFLDEAVGLPGVPRLGLFRHFYGGSLTEERVFLGAAVELPRAGITDGELSRLEADVLYLFTR